jgi:hypothetical protein
MPPRQLRQYRVLFERTAEPDPPDREVDSGLRSKLGGTPDWEQGEEFPNCPHCGSRMTFVGQLDSIEHDWDSNPHRVDCLSGEQHFMFGDVGVIYIFFCFDCSEPRAIFQCG